MQECNTPSMVQDKKGSFSMSDSRFFARLLETAVLIARHADFPGKRQVVERCREEVEDLTRSGVITSDQGETLQGILLGVSFQKAS
jgi:hypothetical protein